MSRGTLIESISLFQNNVNTNINSTRVHDYYYHIYRSEASKVLSRDTIREFITFLELVLLVLDQKEVLR